jgi:hypothetical protein
MDAAGGRVRRTSGVPVTLDWGVVTGRGAVVPERPEQSEKSPGYGAHAKDEITQLATDGSALSMTLGHVAGIGSKFETLNCNEQGRLPGPMPRITVQPRDALHEVDERRPAREQAHRGHRDRILVDRVDERMLQQAYAEAKKLEEVLSRKVKIKPLLVFSDAYLIGKVPHYCRGVTVPPARMLAGYMARRKKVYAREEVEELQAGLVEALRDPGAEA